MRTPQNNNVGISIKPISECGNIYLLDKFFVYDVFVDAGFCIYVYMHNFNKFP